MDNLGKSTKTNALSKTSLMRKLREGGLFERMKMERKLKTIKAKAISYMEEIDAMRITNPN